MACSDSQAPSSNATPIAIVSLSNRADLVSGGDALLEIQGVRSLEKLTVDLNGEDVTGLFGESLDGRILGLVEGLQVGENFITARAGELSAALTLTNHPRGGPVFSGPQIQPWTKSPAHQFTPSQTLAITHLRDTTSVNPSLGAVDLTLEWP